jgi:hypothetical protein
VHRLGTLDVYDPATNTWQMKSIMVTGRRGAAGAVVNGVLYVIGGRDNSGSYLRSVEAYNPATNTWAIKTSMPQGRSGLGAAVQDGLIFAIGGRNGGPGREQPGVLAVGMSSTRLSRLIEGTTGPRDLSARSD